MVRLIKRYGSRKLYDTEESRYVLLEDIAGWIRQGQDVRVIDNKTAEDVTAQTLTQIISEEGRRGTAGLPNDVLHELIRFGQDAVSSGVQRLQVGVDRFVQASIDRLAPIRKAREEMNVLRRRLEELEVSLTQMEIQREPGDGDEPESRPRSTKPKAASRRPRRRTTSRSARPKARTSKSS
ncbi:MAG: polyhydroxyalkanoate synthesis regulator DNA-binding domain-containing protein [Acidobacteriota bacterium]